MSSSAVQEPQFNIGLVVEETGVPADTLRGWERRYGLPQPERTEGGHRLYSAQDIDLIHWLVASKERGLSISRAVDLWRQRRGERSEPAPLDLKGAPGQAMLQDLGAAWRQACLAFDEARAEGHLAQAFALYPAEQVVDHLLLSAMAAMGHDWQANQISVQQEHFASALVERRLYNLLAACPPPHRPGRVLAACPPEEEHSLALLYFTWRLRRQGWDVIYLGKDLPEERLASMLRSTQPDLALMTAARLPTAAKLRQVAMILSDAQVPLAYGGPVFDRYPLLAAYLPGHRLDGDLNQAAAALFDLLEQGPQLRTAEEAGAVGRRSEGLEARLVAISLATARALAQAPFDTSHLEEASIHWTEALVAAFDFSDLSLLTGELDWVIELLQARGMPPGSLEVFLAAYGQVAKQHLEEDYAQEWEQIKTLLDDYLSERA